MTDLSKRDREVLWHPYTQEKTAPIPLGVKRGQGAWLELDDGRPILDGISSWWVNIHGHANPFLNEALRRQSEKLEHVIFAGFTHEPAVELAEKLVAILPPRLRRVFYSDNGSTAVEVALKMAHQYWLNSGEERTTFVALKHAYHGDTFGAMAASDRTTFTRPFRNLLFDVLRADPPGSCECEGECSPICDTGIEGLLERHHKSIAGVIVEPMLQGAGGMITWHASYLKKIRDLCDRYGVLLIADEVLTGFGRTGKMFACEWADISPDIICLSKALTGGYLALGATVATERIYSAFLSHDRSKTFFHGHSYTANPLACAVAAASIELLESEGSLERVDRINSRFNARLSGLIELDHVRDVRIIGAVGAVEIRCADEGYLASVGSLIAREFLSRGLLIRPLGNVVYFMPPYVITESDLDWALDEFVEVISNSSSSD